MRNIFVFLIVLTSFVSSAYAQTQVSGTPPEGINYQAIARDTSGSPLSNCSNLKIRFSIFDSLNGLTPVFTEEQLNVHTNRFGLFTCTIGSVQTSAFSAINWYSGLKFIEVAIDSGGTGYYTLPRTQLLSVPYALHSKTADLSLANWSLFGNQPNSSHFIGTTNNSPLSFKTNSLTRMFIDTTGFIGIGTVNPTARLSIQNFSGNDIEFTSSNSNADIIANSQLNIGSTQFLSFLTSGATRMVIDNSGKIGIGTPSPSAMLEIAGQVKITGGSPGANKVLTSDANGLASWGTPGFPYTLGNGLSLSSSTLNSVWSVSGANIYNNNTGNVGIGTSIPHSELEVVSNNNNIPHGITVSTYDNNSFSDSHLWLKRGRGTETTPIPVQTGDELGFLKFRGFDGSNNGFNTNDETEIGAIAAESFSSTANGSHLIFMTTPIGTTNGTERMRISENGNVGIANASPQSTLDVNGTVTLSGTSSNELNRTQTGAANLVPIAYGYVDQNGGVHANSGNITAVWDGSNGLYKISINNEIYVSSNYITIVTVVNNNAKPTTGSTTGLLTVTIYPGIGGPIQNDFQFVVYKP